MEKHQARCCLHYFRQHSFRCTKKYLLLLSSVMLIAFFMPSISYAQTTQQKRITGTVKDEDGKPISYAYVVIKGQTSGTTTDDNGNYELAINGDVTLTFSFLGFTTLDFSTKGKTVIDVTMREDNVTLGEVVVTGYNSVERQHVSSAIEAVDIAKAQTRPISKLENAFGGTVAGVTLNKSNSAPGEGSSINIRGAGTLQNSAPLVIVDGMEQTMSDIDPSQIRSIHVLKDAASASMYGSRGANGVIIIETNRGQTGDFKVMINTWAAIQHSIEKPDFVNAADYMRLNNEAKTMQQQALLYTPEQIKAAQNGETPSTNWLDEIENQKAHMYNVNATISGGGGVGTFNLMAGYRNESGMNNKEGSNKFSARFNTNVNLADKFILMADFYAHRLQVNRLMSGDGDVNNLYGTAWKMNPTQQIFYEGKNIPDHYILHNDINPVATLDRAGKRNNMYDRITLNLRPRYYILKEFSLGADMSYMIDKAAHKWERQTFKFYDGNAKPVGIWNHDVGSSQGVSESRLTAKFIANYETDLRGKKDKLYVVAGSEIMSNTFTDYKENTKASFFAKATYSFDNRYIAEATVRGDGSSKFAPGHQWGFFPSGSVGWNVHNEAFMEELTSSNIINNLKFRFSYGRIGNENVGPYLWQEIVNTWGWTMRVPNPNFTWEKQTQWNAGVDINILKNRLSLSANVYEKESYDLIYSDFPVPPLTGSYELTTAMNIGEAKNKGWEISANWSDKIGELGYSVGGMLFDNVNTLQKAGHTKEAVLIFKNDPNKIWFKGVPLDNFYGYETDGYFQNQEEIDNTVATLPNTMVGDIKYKDQNGDGVINDEDKVILGSPYPRYNYSVNIALDYKNWDFSALGTGVGKRDGSILGLEGQPVINDGNTNALGTPRKQFMNNRWTPDNRNSRFPRMWTGTSTNSYLSDVWMSDASYFRIKSVQLGYTFKRVTKGISNLRIYANAEDFLTITNWEGTEPERIRGGSGGYPYMATYSLGVQVTFF